MTARDRRRECARTPSLRNVFVLLLSMLMMTCYHSGFSLQQPTFASAQLNTCFAGEVNLQTLLPTTYLIGSRSYTFGFCSAVQPTAIGLANCLPAAGYISYHAVATGVCQTSLSVIRSGLLRVDDNVSTYTVSDASGAEVGIVRMVCDWSSTDPTAASLVTPLSVSTANGVTTTTFTLTSRAACPAGRYFCDISQNIFCQSGLTCINAVCVDTRCTAMSFPNSPAVQSPADFISLFSVSDCHGTPVSNLTRDYFTVTMNGKNVDDASFLGEASLIFEPAAQTSVSTSVPQVTTLLIDQSNSVVEFYEDRMVAAAINMSKKIMNANPNNYVAVVAFDGAAYTYVLCAHTTNQSVVLSALESLPIGTRDLQSTNLYGAVISTLQEAYRMKFSFAGVNASSVFSSVVIFTDGYDTSGRDEESVAVAQASALGEDITVLSIGIANTSDVEFLSTISNGFATFADGVDELATAFDTIADKIISVTQNFYNVLFCMPMRGKSVPIVLGLNQTTFPNATPSTFTVDASGFESGCNETQLRTQMMSPPNISSVGTAILNATGGTLSSWIPPQGAFFFEWNFSYPNNVEQQIFVSPAPTNVYYLMIAYQPSSVVVSTTASPTAGPTLVPGPPNPAPAPFSSPRCVLSPYCYDGVFNTSFRPLQGAVYRAFAVNNIPDMSSGAPPITVQSLRSGRGGMSVMSMDDDDAGSKKKKEGRHTERETRRHQAIARRLAAEQKEGAVTSIVGKSGRADVVVGVASKTTRAMDNSDGGDGGPLMMTARSRASFAAAAGPSDGTDILVTLLATNYIAPTIAPTTVLTTFPTFQPGSTLPSVTSLTDPPITVPSTGFFTVYTDADTVEMDSKLDVPAAVILIVFFILFTILVLALLFYRICTAPENMDELAVVPFEAGGRGAAPPLAIMMKEHSVPLILHSDSLYLQNEQQRGHREGSFDSARSGSGNRAAPAAAAAFAQASPYPPTRQHYGHGGGGDGHSPNRQPSAGGGRSYGNIASHDADNDYSEMTVMSNNGGEQRRNGGGNVPPHRQWYNPIDHYLSSLPPPPPPQSNNANNSNGIGNTSRSASTSVQPSATYVRGGDVRGGGLVVVGNTTAAAADANPNHSYRSDMPSHQHLNVSSARGGVGGGNAAAVRSASPPRYFSNNNNSHYLPPPPPPSAAVPASASPPASHYLRGGGQDGRGAYDLHNASIETNDYRRDHPDFFVDGGASDGGRRGGGGSRRESLANRSSSQHSPHGNRFNYSFGMNAM